MHWLGYACKYGKIATFFNKTFKEEKKKKKRCWNYYASIKFSAYPNQLLKSTQKIKKAKAKVKEEIRMIFGKDRNKNLDT